MPRILLLSDADASRPFGSYQRPFHLARTLSLAGWEVSHLCAEGCASPGLEFRYLKNSFFSNPDSAVRYLRRLWRLPHYDIVFASHLRHGLLFRIVKAATADSARLVIDFHSLAMMDQSTLSGHLLSFCEGVVSRFADHVTVASESLACLLLRLGIPLRKLSTIPNGVDVSRYYPPPSSVRDMARKQLNLSDEFVAILVSPLNFRSNRLALKFTRSVARIALRDFKRVRFLIVGLGTDTQRESMPPNCTVYGYVKDLPLYLFAADVALAPYPSSARSGGARNKVLEYMACGVPVISTLEGMRGIQGAVPNVHFLLADETPIGFLDSISKASSNQNLKTIASDGANLASGNFSWESAGEKLDRVLRNL